MEALDIGQIKELNHYHPHHHAHHHNHHTPYDQVPGMPPAPPSPPGPPALRSFASGLAEGLLSTALTRSVVSSSTSACGCGVGLNEEVLFGLYTHQVCGGHRRRGDGHLLVHLLPTAPLSKGT